MVTTPREYELQLWDGWTGARLGEPIRCEAPARSVAFSPDSTRMVAVEFSPSAGMLDLRTTPRIGAVMQHDVSFLKAEFNRDGSRILTKSEYDHYQIFSDKLLWDGMDGVRVGHPLRHENRIASVTFSPDGTRVLTSANGANQPCSAQIWSGVSGNPLGDPMLHADTAEALWSPDGARVLTISFDRTARLWNGLTAAPFPIQYSTMTL